ncbi:MAG: radical SAM peptide maturase [Bacteroidales bacterium]|nr:radical SAM peptide maturase [Bacteroidales bacterium]
MSKRGWYTFKSKSGHSYLYSNTKKSFIFISDKLDELLVLLKNGSDFSEFLNEKSKNKDSDYEDWLHYYNLLILLRENRYFDDYDRNHFIDDRLTIQDYNIDNCKSLCFEVTQNCNLSCTYCAYGDLYENKRVSDTKVLQFETAKLMIDYAKENFGNKFVITIGFYGGEPLLNFQLIRRIVDYAKNQLEKIDFQMTTNGVLLDRYMDYIAENKFKLAISLDGDVNNNIYRVDNEGGETFERVANNIELLKNKWTEYFRGYVRILSLINFTSNIKEILKFFNDKFQIVPYFSFLSPIDVNKSKLDEYYKMSKDYYKFFGERSIQKSSSNKSQQTHPSEVDLFETLRTYSGNFYENHSEIFLKTKCLRLITGTCKPFEKLFITTNGKILPCERIDQKFFFGEIINGKVIMKPHHVIEQFNSYIDKVSSSCKSCYIIEKCTLCLFHCGFNDEKVVCRNIRDKEEFISMLSNNISYLEEYPELYNLMSKKDYDIVK